MKNAVIVFDDKTHILGTAIGVEIPQTEGELCFNTATTGYQEILTDPSYSRQIITFSFPHIGNVGCNDDDNETTTKEVCRGAIFREVPTNPSNYRSQGSLEAFMKRRNILAICNVDTRLIIEKLRMGKISKCIISREVHKLPQLLEQVQFVPSTKAMDLASQSSTPQAYKYCDGKHKVVVIDYGTKENILRILKEMGMEVYVFPASASFEEISSINPDGVLLSNGPGDPVSTLPKTQKTIQAILDAKIPIFGICLGHQLLCLVAGCNVEKLEQGHRGTNHPVINYQTKKVEITTQNHGFACIENNIPKHVQITHRSLFDGIIEGIKLYNGGFASSVQYHPESSGGPHDSMYLFQEFVNAVQNNKITQ